MKLLIDNKYQDVGFWSFMKCSLLTQLAITGLIYGGVLVLGILLILLE